MPLENRTCFIVNLRDGLCCKNCGKQPLAPDNYHMGFEYHHVVPKSMGGSDAPENIALLCHDCHLDGHRRRLELATLAAGWTLSVPDGFSCRSCTGRLSPRDVEMNCGWYLCAACGVRTHLWNHVFGPCAE